MRICLIIILVVLLLWNIKLQADHPERLTMSSIDGKSYTVKKKFKDHHKASDILARLNYVNIKVIEHMHNKYKKSEEYDTEFLIENYGNGEALSEHTPRTTVNTSYVLNKGDLIKLCLRDPKTNEIHDFNTIVFVNLHELSHLLDKEYGHGKTFWRGFKNVLNSAVELGLYDPIDYSHTPTKYCGMTITSSPYFSEYQ